MANKVVIESKIQHTSEDFGREDINTLAKKVNELVDFVNSL